jgi:hypothetical protein
LKADRKYAKTITLKDVKTVLEIIHVVDKLEKLPAMMAILTKIKDKCTNLDEVLLNTFSDITSKNPTLTSPIFSTQEKMRKKIIGSSYWTEMTVLRASDAKLSSNDYPYILREKLAKLNSQITAVENEKKKNDLINQLSNKKSKGRKNSMVLDFYKVKELSTNRNNSGKKIVVTDSNSQKGGAKR